jgi:hypothetical protein
MNMNASSDLEQAFDQRMHQVYELAKSECGYNATRFLQMLIQHGGVATAKLLLASGKYSEGLTRLWEERRLDISMEATVLQEPWQQLFTEEELEMARNRLNQLGYSADG